MTTDTATPKKKKSSWDGLTPEQKAERVAKMQAGREKAKIKRDAAAEKKAEAKPSPKLAEGTEIYCEFTPHGTESPRKVTTLTDPLWKTWMDRGAIVCLVVRRNGELRRCHQLRAGVAKTEMQKEVSR